MPRPTRKAAENVVYCEQPASKRAKTAAKMGSASSVEAKPKNKVAKLRVMERGDSAADLCTFRGACRVVRVSSRIAATGSDVSPIMSPFGRRGLDRRGRPIDRSPSPFVCHRVASPGDVVASLVERNDTRRRPWTSSRTRVLA